MVTNGATEAVVVTTGARGAVGHHIPRLGVETPPTGPLPSL
jgi:hypothetical protein